MLAMAAAIVLDLICLIVGFADPSLKLDIPRHGVVGRGTGSHGKG